ncbi:RING-H2 finger ATL2-like [Pelobates cultripes]|uniref:RING-H2 finger ATL2-like n=1 Tax=Pelobates cultripes TaxID=61616 RepID=A0AAD1RYE1_PELCU|nr:RING-H2 finger ATL2-like [Pelobates cultripes]
MLIPEQTDQERHLEDKQQGGVREAGVLVSLKDGMRRERRGRQDNSPRRGTDRARRWNLRTRRRRDRSESEGEDRQRPGRSRSPLNRNDVPPPPNVYNAGELEIVGNQPAENNEGNRQPGPAQEPSQPVNAQDVDNNEPPLAQNEDPPQPIPQGAQGDDEQDECSICLSAFDPAEEIMLLHCGHRFHIECIQMWLQEHCTCPMCRAVVII